MDVGRNGVLSRHERTRLRWPVLLLAGVSREICNGASRDYKNREDGTENKSEYQILCFQ